jgi:hypothetical protein
MSIISRVRTTAVYRTFWYFAAERQSIFFRRIRRQPAPWTDDPILARFRFTNAYRASDRTSQYLIRSVIYRDDLPRSPAEVFFRIMLFKLFNKVETWELLEHSVGSLTLEDCSLASVDSVLTQAIASGQRIYSAAYIMPPGHGEWRSPLKHRTHLALLERMMADHVPERLVDARSMQEGFELLRSYPTIGDFLAYQYVIDINYSELTNFSEMDFVVPGPGARDGIRKCFSDLGRITEADVVREVAERQDQEFKRFELHFDSLWGRPLQLVDCQNLFCEVDKYARVRHPEVQGLSGRTRIKRRFVARQEPLTGWYPPKWGLNERIAAAGSAAGSALRKE